MHVVGRLEMKKFLERHPELREEVDELIRDIESREFSKIDDLRQRYPSMKGVSRNTVVFKVRGNRYRLSAKISFVARTLRIVALETHAAYDRRSFDS